jgi:hypothetical protein
MPRHQCNGATRRLSKAKRRRLASRLLRSKS